LGPRGQAIEPPPPETAFGALYAHSLRPRGPKEPFQPSNINFGLLPPLPPERGKRGRGRSGRSDRRARHVERAVTAHRSWVEALPV
jgi:methylenetetrahydrofolate--tRNA-(uracil-5-)-methyltransferase